MQLHVPHRQQQRPGECLAACAEMVLTYLGLPRDIERLKQKLGIATSATPFFYIDRLRSWQLVVERKQGNRSNLLTHLVAGHPIIVPVDTELLPYWITRADITDAERITDHAVVIVGIDDQYIYVNDPDFPNAPQMVEHGWFYDAWRNHDRWYAVIRRRWTW